MIPLLGGVQARRQGPPTYVGGTAGVGGTVSSGLSGGISSLGQRNDIAILALYSTSGSPSSPAGFTATPSSLSITITNVYMRVFYSVLTSNWAGLSTSAGAHALQIWRRVDAGTPLDVATQTAEHAGTSIADPPAITPVTSGAIVVCAGAFEESNTGTISWGGLSGLQAGYNGSSSGGVALAYHEWTSGAYDPPAWSYTESASTRDALSATIALRPRY